MVRDEARRRRDEGRKKKEEGKQEERKKGAGNRGSGARGRGKRKRKEECNAAFRLLRVGGQRGEPLPPPTHPPKRGAKKKRGAFRRSLGSVYEGGTGWAGGGPGGWSWRKAKKGGWAGDGKS